MKFKIFILAIVSFVFSHSDHNNNGHHHHNHNNQNQKTSSIYGKIINEDTKEPIEYASISIYNSESNKLIAGVISEFNGSFQIHNISSGNYFIEVSFIGFENKIIKDILIDGQKNIDADISLKPKAIEGTEITITDDVPVVEFETDKLVYTPSKDILATGGSAEDVLNNVPMVLVDQEGSVTLKGSSNVKILVNGRENRIGEGGNDVDNIPASMIEQVEVITAPSAKYDPEGMAGIINIILKKDRDEGFNAEVKLFTKSNEDHDFGDMGGLSFSTNYKKNKFNIYSSYSNNIRYSDRTGLREAYTTYTDPEPSSGLSADATESNDISYTSTTSRKKKNQVLRAGADYYLSDKLTLNLEGRYNTYTASEKKEEIVILPEPEEKSHEEAEPKGNHEYGISLSADKIYDNPDQELSLFYSYDTHPVDKEYDIIVEDGHRDTTFIDNKYISQEGKLSYSYPLNEKSKFEFGYDFDQTYNRETMDYFLHVHREEEDHDDEDDHEEDVHIAGVNKYSYKRNIHAAFIEYSIELSEKLSLKPGIRFEYVDKNINFNGTPEHWYCGNQEFDSYTECYNVCESTENTCQLTDNPTDELGAYAQILQQNNNMDLDNNYWSVYPSFHITYNISKKRSIQFAISSRVERPGGGHHGGSRQIRPFPREIHSHYFMFLGNPLLKPAYSTNYELSYKSPIPMGYFYTNIYYNDVKDKIEWYSDNAYENFDVTTFRNADKAKVYGTEWFFMIMGQTLGGSFWYNDVQDGTDDAELNLINQGMKMYGKINLPEKHIKYFGLQLGFFYMKMKDDYGSLFGKRGTIWANTGISKSLMNKKAQLSFNVDNIFNSGGFSMERTKPLIEGIDYILPPYTSGEEYTNVESSRNGRTYSITLKYNFGDLQKDQQRFRSTGSDDGGMDRGY